MSGIVVSSGVVSSGLVVNGTETLTVLPGGTVLATMVENDGEVVISSGGYASGAAVEDSGIVQVLGGGTASGFNVAADATEIVSGQVAGGTILGVQGIGNGGTAVDAFVGAGGDQEIISGGVASGSTVSGGTELLFSGATAIGDVIASGGFLIMSGGSDISATLASGASMMVSNGLAESTTVDSGSLAIMQSHDYVAFFSLVNSGGTLMIASGGAVESATVSAGGTLIALPNATAPYIDVTGSGALFIVDDSDTTRGRVSAGGVIELTSGSTTIDIYAYSGGTIIVSSGAFNGYGDDLGGSELVMEGGTSIRSIVSSGGQITDYGYESASIVSSGSVIVMSGAFFEGSVSSGSVMVSGGFANLSLGKVDAVVFSGGTLEGSIASGGSVVVSAGGYVASINDNREDVFGADSIEILSGASGANIVTHAESLEQVYGKTTFDYLSGGTQIIGTGGTTSATTLTTGYETYGFGGLFSVGNQEIMSGGTAISTNISSGFEIVSASGVASNTDLLTSGATMIVSAGGTSIDTTITGGTLVLDQAIAQNGITFAGSGDNLVIVGTVMPSATVSGFGLTDEIDLASVIYRTGGSASFSGDVLTVTEGGQNYELNLAGDYDNATFTLTRGSNFDTIVTVTSLSCFAAGTLIAAERGEVAVEALKVGDFVRTHDGSLRPIIWIGQRQVDCSRHPDPENILPVCVAAHAFGTNEPKRHLFLSPDHAVFRNGVLIPVKQLINGTTVRQIKTDRVTYFHIELPQHAVILAEGLATESYLDTGDRTSFAEGDVTRLHPLFGVALPDRVLVMDVLGCAPLRVTGPEVDRVRAQLAVRVPAERATG